MVVVVFVDVVVVVMIVVVVVAAVPTLLYVCLYMFMTMTPIDIIAILFYGSAVVSSAALVPGLRGSGTLASLRSGWTRASTSR